MAALSNSELTYRRAQLELQLALLLIGMTGLFGKLITSGPAIIVFGRTAISAFVIYVFVRLMRRPPAPISRHALPWLFLSALLLALHWLSFFHAIQVSTVAVGLIGFATFPVFILFLEPLVHRHALRRIDIFSTLLVVIGLLVVAAEPGLSSTATQGLLWAVLSGFVYALLTLLNRKLIRTESAIRLAFGQHAIVALLMIPLLVLDGEVPDAQTIGWLLILGLICTTVPQILLIRILKVLRAHVVAVATALEPVYGIVFAAILLGEVPEVRTLAGGVIVLAAVTLAMWSHRVVPANPTGTAA